MDELSVDGTGQETATMGVGARLRAAREAAGLAIEQVAAETRIPQRHLNAIERGDFASLPSRTYAIGFTRTYSRLLGLDEREILDDVRAELATAQSERPVQPAKFEPGDPARVPGRALAWFAVLATLLLIGGIIAFYRSYLSPGMGPAPLTAPPAAIADTGRTAAQTRPGPAPQVASGPVVFTSTMDGTWVKFYDANGERLYEGQMNRGDSYTLPAEAQGPQLWTGRPYALAITVGGKAVPALSDKDEIIRDVPVSAEALLARGSAPRSAGPTTAAPAGALPATASPAPASTPAAGGSATP